MHPLDHLPLDVGFPLKHLVVGRAFDDNLIQDRLPVSARFTRCPRLASIDFDLQRNIESRGVAFP